MTAHTPSTGRSVVCIQGLGFVGAAMAVAVASASDENGAPRFDVVGVDLPTPGGRERVEKLNAGVFPFRTVDYALVDAAARAHARGNLRACCEAAAFAEADVIVVDVHLDVDASGPAPTVRLEPFRDAIRAIGERMPPGTLVIVETTVPPGTCAQIVAPELAAAMRRRGLRADAFLLAHSYERVMPGAEYLASIMNFWRVYAGHTLEAADACERFLAAVINVRGFPLRRLASTTASETAKVLENSYRATNIAFIEEWARFAESVGVDLFEVVDAIRVRPTHSNIRQPGFGVGGYCLTKDPLFAGIAARELFGRPDLAFPFSDLAVATNARMPLVTLDRVEELLGGSLARRRVLLMGIAYRQDVADTRYSPAQPFVEEARRRGADVSLHDPLVDHWQELDLPVAQRLPDLDGVDAIVFAVPHGAYRALDLAGWLAGRTPVVVDANAVLTPTQRAAAERAGCMVAVIGAGRVSA